MSRQVLFIDTVHPFLQDRLEEMGMICIDGSQWDLPVILEKINLFTGIVIRSRFKIDEKFLNHCSVLKFIARAGAGMENIDVEEANRRGIICINAPEGNRNAVAEHALGMLLALMNRLIISDTEVRNGIWKREENRGTEVEGKTVGIIGFGNNGSAFAEKLIGFNCRVLTYDPYATVNRSRYRYVEQSGLDELFAECDIVSLHVPLTSETSYMVNHAFLTKFSKPIWLLNTSRGKVVNTADLVTALQTGKVRGAGLDVLEYESLSFESLKSDEMPETFKYLVKSDKVILTPHIAGWTYESHRKISEVLAGKISAI